MKSRFELGKPSPAMLVALIALAVALGGTSYAAINLPKNSVGTNQLKKDSVTTAKLKNKSVTTGKLKKDAVNTAKLKGAAVTAAKLGGGAVTNSKLSDGSVDSAKVGDGSLQAQDFAPGLLGATGAAGGDLTGTYPNPQIAPASVGPAELSSLPAARVYSSSAQEIANSTASTVLMDAVSFDPSGMFNNAADALTVSIPGTYLISGGVSWESDPTGFRSSAIRINGAPVDFSSTAGAGEPLRVPVVSMARLEAGDQVTLTAFQNSGGPLSLESITVPLGRGWLSAAWIGP